MLPTTKGLWHNNGANSRAPPYFFPKPQLGFWQNQNPFETPALITHNVLMGSNSVSPTEEVSSIQHVHSDQGNKY
ncbi:hypothetical protein ACFX13_020543 [Malus domestica]